MPADPGLIRAAGLLLPLTIVWCLYLWRKPERRETAAALLACVWNVPALLLLHLLAMRYGWWRFEAQGGLLLKMPVDFYLGWVLLWGALPVLAFPRLRLVFVIAIMLAVDLLLMPSCQPVLQLGRAWLAGEAVALVVCLAPAQLLARWTRDDRHLNERALLQVITFGGLMLGVLPAIIIEQTGGSWAALLKRPAWLGGLELQALMIPVILGLTAVQEFVRRGKGTPVPFDPPKRLVTSGVYAYIANPMQLAMCLTLAGWGLMLENLWVAGAGLVAFAYSAGLAAWDEGGDLTARYGDAWKAYRRKVRRWCPHWRPRHASSARLYVAEECGQCREIKAWLSKRNPVALEIIAAEDHPSRDLRRITYEACEEIGTEDDKGFAEEVETEEGVAAFARALEHIHLGWALAGWTMRLPVVRGFLQILVDAAGGAPRRVRRRNLLQYGSKQAESGGMERAAKCPVAK